MEYWILVLPDISGGIQFSYAMVSFIGLILALLLSFITCMRGYKVIRLAFLAGACIVLGLAGYRIADRFTSDLIIKLVFFLSAIFIGVVFLQLLLLLLGLPAKALKLDRLFMKTQFWLTSLLGAGAFGALVYFRVYHSLLAAVSIGVALALAGSFAQYRHKRNEIPAHTYDDLLRRRCRPDLEGCEDESGH